MAKHTIFRKNRLVALTIIALLFSVPVSFLFVNVAKADVIFADGFETGNFNSWTSTTGSPTIVKNPVNSGTYSANFSLATPACYATKTIAPTTTLNYTYYVYFGGLTNNYICLIMAEDANNNSIFCRVEYSEGTWEWQFNAGNGQVINATTPTVQLGQWYKIQLLAMTGSNSTFYFLVDDQLKATITNQTFAAINQLRIGNDWDEGYLGGETYFDDAVATNVITPIITAFAGEGGSITPSGVVSVNYDGSQTFNITANTGYHIADVLVDGSSVGAVSTWSFNNVRAVNSITASFAINTYTISASADANGAISPNGNIVVNYGSSPTFNITANTGYHILDVTVNGSSVDAVNSYTLKNVQAAYTIRATFAADPTPTPTPSPTPTQTTTPTSTPTSTPTPKSSPSPTPMPTPTPIPTASSSPTASPSVQLSTASGPDYTSVIIIAILLIAAIASILFYLRKNRNSTTSLPRHK